MPHPGKELHSAVEIGLLYVPFEEGVIKGVHLRFDGLEHFDGVAQTPEFTEQTDELGLEEVLVVEAVFYDEWEELVEFFHGRADL